MSGCGHKSCPHQYLFNDSDSNYRNRGANYAGITQERKKSAERKEV